jgi:signal transduction histidine kinase
MKENVPGPGARISRDESPQKRLRRLLRELAGLLVTLPGDGDGRFAETGVSVERTAQVAGLQAVLLPVLTAPLVVLVPPTDAIGDAGWAVALVALSSVVAIGLRLVKPPAVSASALALTNAYTALVLGVLTWLGGGFVSPFPLLLILVAASIAPHRPPLRRALLAWLVLVAFSPMLYEEPLKRDLAEALMISATAVATLLTMLWLSARVRRAEVGLMDAATVAQREQERAEKRAGRLEEVDVRRERLVSRVSHELRTPLTSIRGYLEALLEGVSGELAAEQRDYAAVALRNTVRLERLIGDLLLLSSVEAGQVKLRSEPIDVRELLRSLCEELAPIASERDISIEVVDDTGVTVHADRDRIAQAMTNLISNAIKYSGRGEAVTLTARGRSPEVWLEVVDHGVGIPASEIDRIGERFYRASTASEVTGTGLGLAITRELVELHGGRLELESEEGRGSLFRIRLPSRARD